MSLTFELPCDFAGSFLCVSYLKCFSFFNFYVVLMHFSCFSESHLSEMNAMLMKEWRYFLEHLSRLLWWYIFLEINILLMRSHQKGSVYRFKWKRFLLFVFNVRQDSNCLKVNSSRCFVFSLLISRAYQRIRKCLSFTNILEISSSNFMSKF